MSLIRRPPGAHFAPPEIPGLRQTTEQDRAPWPPARRRLAHRLFLPLAPQGLMIDRLWWFSEFPRGHVSSRRRADQGPWARRPTPVPPWGARPWTRQLSSVEDRMREPAAVCGPSWASMTGRQIACGSLGLRQGRAQASPPRVIASSRSSASCVHDGRPIREMARRAGRDGQAE